MFTWKILDVDATDGLITQAKYEVKTEKVETEGYWHFDAPKSLDGATEESVIEWVRQATMKNGVNAVESRIMEQVEAKLEALHLPWKAKTFKVTV